MEGDLAVHLYFSMMSGWSIHVSKSGINLDVGFPVVKYVCCVDVSEYIIGPIKGAIFHTVPEKTLDTTQSTLHFLGNTINGVSNFIRHWLMLVSKFQQIHL